MKQGHHPNTPQPALSTRNSSVETGTIRLRTALREFSAYVRSRYAEETQKHYERAIRGLSLWIANRPPGQRVHNVADLTPDVLSDYQRFLNTQMRRPEGQPFTQSMKEDRLYPLKTFLRFLYRKGFLAKDLRRLIYIPQREHKVPRRLLTIEEMTRLLETPSERSTIGIRDRAMLEIAYSGLRASELLTLALEDVDIKENRIFIRQAKGYKDRVVPMTNQAIYWLERWLSRRKDFLRRGETQLLFISRGGRPIARRLFARSLEKYVLRAKLPVPVAPHDLRRITATYLAANGAPIRYIQALLGHVSLKITSRYLRFTDEQIKAEYERTHPSNKRSRHTVTVA